MSRHKLKKIEGHSNFYLNETSGVIYYKDEEHGKFSTGKRTLREAKRAADEKKITIKKNRSMAMAKRDVMKLNNPLIRELYFERLEEKRVEVKPSTMPTWERSYTTGFGDFFKGKDREHVNDFTDQNLMKFKKWYLEDRGTRHAKKMVVHMKDFIRWLFKNKLLAVLPDLEILDNLHELVEKKAKREPVGRNLSATETEKLLAAAKANSEFMHLMVLLGVRYGLRKESEALALLWEKVDLKKKEIQIYSEKNHGWRKVPITEQTVEAFKAQREWIKENFPSIPVRHVIPMKSLPTIPMSGQVFDKHWIDVKAAAGIKGRLRFHDLRHTFATKTAEDNWSPVVACKALDMSLVLYQKTYCHPSDESVAEMMRKTHEKAQKNEGKSK